MFKLPVNINKGTPETNNKALNLGAGGSLLLLVTWGFIIANADQGTPIKPVAEMLITVIVLLVSGTGCIGIALAQFLDARTRRESFISLFYGLLPVITFVFILGFLRFVMNVEFA